MQSVFRMLKFAVQGMMRNFWLSFVTISVFILTLLTVNVVISLQVMADVAIKSVEDMVHVEIDLEPGTSAATVAAMTGYLSGLPQVKEVTTIPASEALIAFKERHANEPDILAALEEVGENPLGDALRIKANKATDFPFILEAVETPEFSAVIREKNAENYEAVIASMTAIGQKVRFGGFVLAGFFSLIAVLMVFNTVRVAVYIHRDEIAVMRLVGARDGFIRGPFFIEVIFYSGVAVLVTIGLLALALFLWEPALQSFFTGTNLSLSSFYLSHGWLIFGGQTLGLMILGIGTTALAMRRYLRI